MHERWIEGRHDPQVTPKDLPFGGKKAFGLPDQAGVPCYAEACCCGSRNLAMR